MGNFVCYFETPSYPELFQDSMFVNLSPVLTYLDGWAYVAFRRNPSPFDVRSGLSLMGCRSPNARVFPETRTVLVNPSLRGAPSLRFRYMVASVAPSQCLAPRIV